MSDEDRKSGPGVRHPLDVFLDMLARLVAEDLARTPAAPRGEPEEDPPAPDPASAGPPEA